MPQPTADEMLDALEAALRRRGRITVAAAGLSMGPAFAGADSVTIETTPTRQPAIGEIAVYRRNAQWIAHRVVWRFRASSRFVCATKGDRVNALDRPFVRREEYVGVIVEIRRGQRIRNLMSRAERIRGAATAWAGMVRIPIAAVCRRLRPSPPPTGTSECAPRPE